MEKHCCFCISFNLISCVLCVLFLLHWTLRARMFLQSVPFLDIFFTYIYIYLYDIYMYISMYFCNGQLFPPWPRSGINIRSYSPVFIGQTDTRNPIVGEGIKSLSFYTIFFLYKLFLTPADSSLTKLIELRFVFTKRHSVGYVCRIFCQPIFKPKMSSVVNIRRCHTLHATVNSGALPACTFTGEPHWLPLKSYHHPPLWWPILPPHPWPWKLLITSPFLFSHPINMTYKK